MQRLFIGRSITFGTLYRKGDGDKACSDAAAQGHGYLIGCQILPLTLHAVNHSGDAVQGWCRRRCCGSRERKQRGAKDYGSKSCCDSHAYLPNAWIQALRYEIIDECE